MCLTCPKAVLAHYDDPRLATVAAGFQFWLPNPRAVLKLDSVLQQGPQWFCQTPSKSQT